MNPRLAPDLGEIAEYNITMALTWEVSSQFRVQLVETHF